MTFRITRDEMLLRMASIVALRGTCNRLLVGAILARDSRPIVAGYNGKASGLDHCNHRLDESSPCTEAVHAEANALVFAARYGIATQGAELYVTHSPCITCARLIINAGIKRVVFRNLFRDMSGVEFLVSAGIPCILEN